MTRRGQATARLAVLLLIAVGCRGDLPDSYAANLATRRVESQVFGGVEIGMLRPEAMRRLEGRFGEFSCDPVGDTEECSRDVGGDYPGALYAAFREGRLWELMLLLDSDEWTGVTPEALASRFEESPELRPTESGKEVQWLNPARGIVAAVSCSEGIDARECSIAVADIEFVRDADRASTPDLRP